MNAATEIKQRSQPKVIRELSNLLDPLIKNERAAQRSGYTYLICFGERIGSSHPRGGARHYCGSTSNVYHRLCLHRQGRGARITRYCVENGIPLRLARRWPHPSLTEARIHEIRLKREKHLSRHCPFCGSPF